MFGSGRSRMVGGWMAGTFGFGVESEIIENLAEVLERKEGRKEEGEKEKCRMVGVLCLKVLCV